MPTKTIAQLKAYFQTGLKPTQAQFEDLIDSTANSLITAAPINGTYMNLVSYNKANTQAGLYDTNFQVCIDSVMGSTSFILPAYVDNSTASKSTISMYMNMDGDIIKDLPLFQVNFNTSAVPSLQVKILEYNMHEMLTSVVIGNREKTASGGGVLAIAASSMISNYSVTVNADLSTNPYTLDTTRMLNNQIVNVQVYINASMQSVGIMPITSSDTTLLIAEGGDIVNVRPGDIIDIRLAKIYRSSVKKYYMLMSFQKYTE